MKELSQHKFKFNPYLEDLYQSDKPLIIYKVDDGYNIYTDFSKKIVLTKKNIHNFLKSLGELRWRKNFIRYDVFKEGHTIESKSYDIINRLRYLRGEAVWTV